MYSIHCLTVSTLLYSRYWYTQKCFSHLGTHDYCDTTSYELVTSHWSPRYVTVCDGGTLN